MYDLRRRGFHPVVHHLRREESEIRGVFRRFGVEPLNVPDLPFDVVLAVVGQAVHGVAGYPAEFPESGAFRVIVEVEVVVGVPLGLYAAVVFLPVGGVKLPVEFLARLVYQPHPEYVREEVAVIPQQECALTLAEGFVQEHFPIESLVFAVTFPPGGPVRDLFWRVEASRHGNPAVRGYAPGAEIRLSEAELSVYKLCCSQMSKPGSHKFPPLQICMKCGIIVS